MLLRPSRSGLSILGKGWAIGRVGTTCCAFICAVTRDTIDKGSRKNPSSRRLIHTLPHVWLLRGWMPVLSNEAFYLVCKVFGMSVLVPCQYSNLCFDQQRGQLSNAAGPSQSTFNQRRLLWQHTNYGASTPMTSHKHLRRYISHHPAPCRGKFKCSAFQMQSDNVTKEEDKIPNVPRKERSGFQTSSGNVVPLLLNNNAI